MLLGSLGLLFREYLPIMTPSLLFVSLNELCLDLSFFMRSKLWLYQTKALFIICTPDTDVTKKLLVKELFSGSLITH